MHVPCTYMPWHGPGWRRMCCCKIQRDCIKMAAVQGDVVRRLPPGRGTASIKHCNFHHTPSALALFARTLAGSF